MFGGFDFFFRSFGVMFALTFCIILVVFVVVIVKGVLQWSKNNRSPQLSVEARISGKRMSVQHHHHQDGMSHHSTSYYVTFEVESKDRMEFHVSAQEYGLLSENDQGILTFQGTRYLGFERRR